ncbi:hypothetical protein F5Y16DRAFT_412512 [Xylariaceae sp. FL0255]|nr:hypothetical protein F5Y16DRAFT_412512 [Xylariaceae sp. FL0255]
MCSLQLERFPEEDSRPPYAVLSHTWLPDEEEIKFQDLSRKHEGRLSQASTPSLTRIALETYALKYAWLDTCCIDKRSADLPMAINSMSKWYQSAVSALLSSITRIPYAFLYGHVPLSDACVAKKMSWAARRTTTRPEDMAYSLLGIFDVNMPIIYGKGDIKAFIHLQEESFIKLTTILFLLGDS